VFVLAILQLSFYLFQFVIGYVHHLGRARIGTVRDGMPYWHFSGRVKNHIVTSFPICVNDNGLNKKFDKLILKKIITTGIAASRCHILKLKCTKFVCLGIRPMTRWGSLQRSADPLAGFKEAYF